MAAKRDSSGKFVKSVEMPDFTALTRGLFETIAEHAANQAISHFKESFEKEGFTDHSFIAWPNKAGEAITKILYKSGNLSNSIVAASVTADRVEIQAGAGLPYAAIQNNGGVIKVRVTEKMKKFFWAMYKETAHEHWKWMALTKKEFLTIKIPQRQYIGNSETLNKDIDNIIISAMHKSLQNLKFS